MKMKCSLGSYEVLGVIWCKLWQKIWEGNGEMKELASHKLNKEECKTMELQHKKENTLGQVLCCKLCAIVLSFHCEGG